MLDIEQRSWVLGERAKLVQEWYPEMDYASWLSLHRLLDEVQEENVNALVAQDTEEMEAIPPGGFLNLGLLIEEDRERFTDPLLDSPG